jgi:hypothetical protein
VARVRIRRKQRFAKVNYGMIHVMALTRQLGATLNHARLNNRAGERVCATKW